MENMVILGRSKRSGEQLALFEEPNVTASLVPFPARQGTWDVVVNTPPPPQKKKAATKCRAEGICSGFMLAGKTEGIRGDPKEMHVGNL